MCIYISLPHHHSHVTPSGLMDDTFPLDPFAGGRLTLTAQATKGPIAAAVVALAPGRPPSPQALFAAQAAPGS